MYISTDFAQCYILYVYPAPCYRRTTLGLLPLSKQHTLYTNLHQTLYSPHGDWAVICDSAPSGGFEVVLHNMLHFPLFIYQSGLELWCACSEEF